MAADREAWSTERYVTGVRNGDRRTLARAITLIESRRPTDESQARALLEQLLPYTGSALRVGITGVPGVGKSSFIEALGQRLVKRGRQLAVLAVDPSSSRSGGSILGDKTRMATLARHPEVFIRPSPGAGTLGGVARRTREAMLLCEAAGFDVVFVETIGVGQSETAVADMVDFFLLLMLAGAGDDLQGIKRGIMELADLLVITKVDGDNQAAAARAAADYERALHILQSRDPDWQTPVRLCSALTGEGLDECRQVIEDRQQQASANGGLDRRRSEQNLRWLDRSIEELVLERFFAQAEIHAKLPELRRAVRAGELPPSIAAQRLIDRSPNP